jgi:hypothetical protein
METNKIFLSLLLLLCLSCQEQLIDDFSIDQEKGRHELRSTPIQNNPFDWENIRTVHFAGVDRVLPWHSGAMGGLPFHIILDYKKEDGWVMVYNFLTELNAEGFNTVIFYNKFRSILRVFYYNLQGITAGGTTFAQLNISDANTKLLHNLTASNYSLALNQNGTNVAQTTNIGSVPGIAIGHGWNCFDFELTYDNTISKNNSVIMNIQYYDRVVQKLEINGQQISLGELSYVTTSSKNPFGDAANSVFSSVATATGNEVGSLINRQPDSDNTRLTLGPIIGSAVSSVISSAINGLTKSWTSSWGRTEQTYKTIDIKMSSEITLTGTNSSTIPSQGVSIQNLTVPGSAVSGVFPILPIYDKPLGAWTLKAVKPFRVNSHYITTFEVTGGNRHDPDATDIEWTETSNLHQFHPVYSKSDIIINPNVLDHISDYTVTSQLYVIRNNSGTLRYEAWTNTYKNPYRFIASLRTPWEFIDLVTSELIRTPAPTEYFNGELKFVTKVTVRLFPKAPYSADVIESVRTFETKVERINIPSRAKPEWF